MRFSSLKSRRTQARPANSASLHRTLTLELLEDRLCPSSISDALGKLPLSFEANQGQTDSQVQFLARGGGYTLFLTSTEAVLSLQGRQASTRAESKFVEIQKSRSTFDRMKGTKNAIEQLGIIWRLL